MLTPSTLPGRLGVFLAVVFLALFIQTKPVRADAIITYDFTGQIIQQWGINVGLGGSTQPPTFAGSFTYTVPGGGVVPTPFPFAQAYNQPNGNIFATVFGSDGTPYPMGLNYPTPNEPKAPVPLLTLASLPTSINQLSYTFQITNGADAWLTASLPTGETVGPTTMRLTVPGINSLNLSQLNLLSLGANLATLQIQGQIIGTNNTTPFLLLGNLTTLTLDPTSDPVPVSGGQTVNSPEPGALALLASSGVVGLVFWRRQRRKVQSSRSA
jgi:PEP-CTERM motif